MQNHPKHISISHFNYDLPEEKIAKYPVEPRDASKLLIYQQDHIQEDRYFNLHQHLPENTLLVMNNTKVIEARLLFKKDTGAVVELFCLEPEQRYTDITATMLQKEKVQWICLIGGAKKWKEGKLEKEVLTNAGVVTLTAEKGQAIGNSYVIHFSWNHPSFTFAEVLHFAGVIPLPPYIKREVDEKDKTSYQTIYAQKDGSVAAPTAGLHFTQAVMENLQLKNIDHHFVTLHVGAGTFMPVKSQTLEGHQMHSEWIDVSKETIERVAGGQYTKMVAVGTTSLRTLETLYWMGVKCGEIANASIEEMAVLQWDAYELNQNVSKQQAMENLLKWMNQNKQNRIITKTQLLIAPGYQLRMVDGLITNFHQPQSTLLLLVHAFVGDNWQKIYQYALNHHFRFLSYGDGSLLWKQNNG